MDYPTPTAADTFPTPPEAGGAAGVSGPWRIVVHTTLAQAEPAWRKLQKTGISYGFQTYEWLSTWQSLLGDQGGVSPAIVEVRTETLGAPVMLVPLGVYPKNGLKILSFLGGWLTDYHAPLLDPDFARALGPQGFLELWRRILKALPRADYIHFWRMPEDVEGVPNPFVCLAGAKANEQNHFTVLSGDYDAYVKSRSSNFLKKAQRRRRRLQELGPVAFSVVTDPAELGSTMDALVRQKSRRHLETAGSDPYSSNPRLRQFYERLALTGREDPKGFLGRLTVGGEVVATEWGFVHRKRFLDILPSYEAGEWSKYSPGMIIKEDILRWCIDQGLEIYDLTVGDEAYKARLTESVMPVYVYRKPLNPRGTAYWAAVQLRLLAKKLLGPLARWIRSRSQ